MMRSLASESISTTSNLVVEFTSSPIAAVPLRAAGKALTFVRAAGQTTLQTVKLPRAMLPLIQIFSSSNLLTEAELSGAFDQLFDALYKHTLISSTSGLTTFLRDINIIPNESSTEKLISYVLEQVMLRSPIPLPDIVIEEFWSFFYELFSSPEIKGLGELNLDLARLVLKTYEPMLVESINSLKELQRANRNNIDQVGDRAQMVVSDVAILKRQIKALRYIKPFLQTDPKDFKTQAHIVADMVREFGPLFVKMAQVAAANADFLPDEIAKELTVFQDDVEPMRADEVLVAFNESFACHPSDMYDDFKIDQPIKSGSIGSVYIANKSVMAADGNQKYERVIIKVGRHNLEREFLMGKASIGLVLLSSHYWAPHSKIAPFLEHLLAQVTEFTRGFEEELDFKKESEIQHRFWLRNEYTPGVNVPKVHRSTVRIIEMELADNAVGVNYAVQKFKPRHAQRFQRKVAKRFLNAMLVHIFQYREFHGDLHPGNVLVDDEAHVHLIDWGNVVDLQGKWSLIGHYIRSAILADVDELTDTLISISTDPESNIERRDEIHAALCEVLEKRNIVPSSGLDLARFLLSEGLPGVLNRLQTSTRLLSKSQQLGIVTTSEYLHLSRSIFAFSGTYANLYNGVPARIAILDACKVIADFPSRHLFMQTKFGASMMAAIRAVTFGR